MRLLVCFFCFFVSPFLFAEEELIVEVESQERLLPVTWTFEQRNKQFSEDYFLKLQSIVTFDWNYNGITEVSEEKNTVYSFSFILEGMKLSVQVSGLLFEEDVFFKDILLSGYLEKDRSTLHRLHDQIYAELFNEQGGAASKILYTLKKTEGKKSISEVWECDADGGNSRQVTHHGEYCVTPTYISSPSGLRPGSFLYVSYKTGQPKIHIASLKEGVGRPLVSLWGNQLMPKISQNRDRLVFISDATGNPDLFIQEYHPSRGVVGKPRHLYSVPFATQGSPAFSPDGGKIAFVSNKSGTARIYVLEIPPKGTPIQAIQPKLVSKFTRDNTAPSWSPDGNKIAYCGMVNGVRQIIVYDCLTGKEKIVSIGGVHKENPSWSPNSRVLVYNTSGENSKDLHLILLKNGNSVRISKGSGAKRFPSWGG